MENENETQEEALEEALSFEEENREVISSLAGSISCLSCCDSLEDAKINLLQIISDLHELRLNAQETLKIMQKASKTSKG